MKRSLSGESAMDIITSLPTILASMILAEWLDFKSLVKLDSACCSNFARSGLQRVITSPGCPYNGFDCTFNQDDTIHVVRWISQRGIKISNVRFTSSIDVVLFSSFMEATGESLISVEFLGVKNDFLMEYMFLEVAKCSLGVTSLYLRECVMTNSMWTVFSKFETLASLTICSDADVSSPSKRLDLANCPMLRCVKLSGRGVNYGSVIALVKLSSNLLQLRMRDMNLTTKNILHVASYCPHIRSLGLVKMSKYLGSVVAEIGSKICLHLKHLDLSRNSLSDEAVLPVIQTLTLHSLCLENNNFLTGKTLLAIAEHQKDTLHTLLLAHKNQFSSVACAHLLKECTHLHTLSVGGDTLNSLFGLAPGLELDTAFFESAAKLETLLLFGDNANNECLRNVATYGALHLKHLGILTPCSVTSGVSQVVRKCKRLETLLISETKETPHFVTKWKQMNPKLSIRLTDDYFRGYDLLNRIW